MSNRISIDQKDIERAERMLAHISGAAPKALANALNRSLENARANAVRGARENYNVQARDVRETIKLTRAKPNQLTGSVKSTGSVIPLSSFKVSPKTVNGRRRTPVRVGVKKGTSETIDRGFIARLGSHIGVAIRLGQKRLPIRQLYGPAVPQMLNNENVVNMITEESRKTFDERLSHEIDRVLKDGGK